MIIIDFLKYCQQNKGLIIMLGAFNAPDPIEAIKFRMEQMGMDNKDLADIIGYKSRVSEIFSGKKKTYPQDDQESSREIKDTLRIIDC